VTTRMALARIIIGTSLVLLGGCASEPLPLIAAGTRSPEIANPQIDAALGEKLQENEKEIAGKIAAAIEVGMRRRFVAGQRARRDAHPKSHGCVAAKFKVARSLPEDLAKGVFVRGKTYDALIRFSNADEDANRPDFEGDGRGMAIKLLGVPGEKLLNIEQESTTQDFIMISHPVFLIDNISDYLFLLELNNSDRLLTKIFRPITIPFALGLKGTSIAWATTAKKIANPLYARYWSTVPYQLGTDAGRKAIKFSARPCFEGDPKLPTNPSANFLREAMAQTLENGAACMEFLVQPRTSSAMSVENSQVEWLEANAPFHKVASISIPKQKFDTLEQNNICENLSFNPWHALPEHRPLGSINRLRKVIYPYLRQVRQELNSLPVNNSD